MLYVYSYWLRDAFSFAHELLRLHIFLFLHVFNVQMTSANRPFFQYTCLQL